MTKKAQLRKALRDPLVMSILGDLTDPKREDGDTLTLCIKCEQLYQAEHHMREAVCDRCAVGTPTFLTALEEIE